MTRCYFCNLFMSLKKDHVRFTPYGNSLDLEPPDPEFGHVDCYKQSNQRSLKRICWSGPHIMNGKKED